jgi:hypothetical protein
MIEAALKAIIAIAAFYIVTMVAVAAITYAFIL